MSVRDRLGKTAQDISNSEHVAPVVSSAGSSAVPVTVFLDAAHIRFSPEYQKRHLDVVIGKAESSQMCRRFGLQQVAQSPSRQLRHDLKAIGWDGDSPVTVISDGEPALPDLVRDAFIPVRARCRELYTCLANNMDSLTEHGRR